MSVELPVAIELAQESQTCTSLFTSILSSDITDIEVDKDELKKLSDKLYGLSNTLAITDLDQSKASTQTNPVHRNHKVVPLNFHNKAPTSIEFTDFHDRQLDPSADIDYLLPLNAEPIRKLTINHTKRSRELP